MKSDRPIADLHKRFPFLDRWEERSPRIWARLRPFYREYVAEVSTPGRAISLPAAVLIHFLCEGLGARRILDLGSGFSSVTLRLYAQGHPAVNLVCVDDDARWLARTKGFLRRKGLAHEGLLEWSSLCNGRECRYDLIIHDLGTMKVREQTLSYVLAAARQGEAVLLLDDMHKPRYRKQVLARLAELPQANYFDLQQYTLDEFGRFCGLVCDVGCQGRKEAGSC